MCLQHIWDQRMTRSGKVGWDDLQEPVTTATLHRPLMVLSQILHHMSCDGMLHGHIFEWHLCGLCPYWANEESHMQSTAAIGSLRALHPGVFKYHQVWMRKVIGLRRSSEYWVLCLLWQFSASYICLFLYLIMHRTDVQAQYFIKTSIVELNSGMRFQLQCACIWLLLLIDVHKENAVV